MAHTQETEVHLRILTELLASREKSVTDWIKFLVTVQAGLFVGFVFILIQPRAVVWEGDLGKLLIVAVPLFAILVAVGALRIIRRERVWHQWFNFKIQALTNAAIFPEGYFTSKYKDKRTPQEPNDMHPGRITRTLTVMTGTLILAWLVVGSYAFVKY